MDLQKFSGGCRFSSVVQPVPGLQGLANLAEKDKADRSDRASLKLWLPLLSRLGILTSTHVSLEQPCAQYKGHCSLRAGLLLASYTPDFPANCREWRHGEVIVDNF